MVPTWAAETTLPRLSEETGEEAAQLLARTLLRLAEGPPDDPATWLRVAQRLSLRFETFHEPGGCRGEYAPYSDRGAAGVIAVNTAYLEIEQSRAWVHELSHHFLHVWVPPQLCDAADVYSYSGDTRDVRHRIARRVEELILP